MITVMLAEVSDKVPSMPHILVGGCLLATAGFVLASCRWWLGVLPLLITIFFDYVVIDELRNPIGRAILEENGWGLLGLAGVAWNCPILTAYLLIIACRTRSRRKRATLNPCLQCGYSLIGNVSGRCPECGREASLPVQKPSLPVQKLGPAETRPETRPVTEESNNENASE